MRSHRPADLLHAAGLPGRLHHRQPRGRGRVVRPAPRASRGPQRGRRARHGPWSHARRLGSPGRLPSLSCPVPPLPGARHALWARVPRAHPSGFPEESALRGVPALPRCPGPQPLQGAGGPGGPCRVRAQAQISVWEKGLSRRVPRGPPQAGWQWGGGAALLSLAPQRGPRPPREHSLAAGGGAREAPHLCQGTWLSAVVPRAQHGAAGLPSSGDTRGQLVPWVASSARVRLVGALHLRTACPGRPRPAAPQWVPSGGPVPLRFRGESF